MRSLLAEELRGGSSAFNKRMVKLRKGTPTVSPVYLKRSLRTVSSALGSRRKLFTLVAIGVFLLNVLLPPVVLSVARKPVDFVMLNPYLNKLPEYLSSSEPIGEKISFISKLALFWFVSANPFGTEWGYIVTLADVIRFTLMSFIFGAYFSTWSYVRASNLGKHSVKGAGGAGGTVLSILGFSSGPCSVVGCGAPVIPVLGLAFVGLSTTSLLLLADISKATTLVVIAIMALGVIYLGGLNKPQSN